MENKNTVTGNTFGDISRGVRIGDEIHYHYGDRKIKRLLTQSPFQAPIFLGRDKDLETVHQKLFAGQNFLMLVNGQGGIGKTTFASKYWAKYELEYSHLAFLFVENGIANALLSLAPTLGLQFTNETQTDTQKLQILMQTVSNLQKPCLLILDNANDKDDLEENIELLRTCPNFHILLTSRIGELASENSYKIGVLEGNFPLELFTKYYPQHQENENDLFWSFFELVGGNTLVIEIIAKNLREINSENVFYSLQSLLKDLQNKGLLQLSEQEKVKVHWQKSQKAVPETLIKAMYDLHPLDDAEKQVLSIFSVLPAENIAYDSLKSFLKPDNERHFAKTLKQLFTKGWIEKNTTENKNYYKISPVVQEITRHKNQERLFEDCEGMMINIDKLFKNTYLDNPRVAYFEYTPIAISILHYLNTDIPNLLLGKYSSICRSISWTFKNYRGKEQSIFYANKALSLAEATKNEQLIAEIMGAIIDIYRTFGSKDEALRCGQSSYNYYKNSTQQQNLHNVANNLALAIADFENKDMLRMAFAEKILLDGIKYAEENNDLDDLARRTANLGYLYNKVGQTSDCIIQYENAANIYENNSNSKLGSIPLYTWYHSLTRLYHNQNNYEKGLIFGYKAKKEGESLRFDSQHELFNKLLNMIKEMEGII